MKRLILVLSLVTLVLLGAEAKKPSVLYLVGDEVVASMTAPEDLNDSSAVGWGQVLGDYLPGVEIVNRAYAGATTRAMLTDGQWADIMTNVPKKAFMMINLGHHEYDETDPRVYSTLEEFENNLLQMIAEAQKKRVKVILITPTTKRFFYDSSYYPRHGAYAEGVRRVAQQQKLPLVDLEAATRARVEDAGESASAVFFAGGDAVLLNDTGARMAAKIVAETVKELKIKGL